MRPKDFRLFIRPEKSVSKTAFKCGDRSIIRPDVDRTVLDHVKPANIIEAHDVICMGMGINHSIDPIDFVREALHPQFGRGIDQDREAIVPDKNRRPIASIMRISAGANGAVAPYHGNSGAGAGAEEK